MNNLGGQLNRRRLIFFSFTTFRVSSFITRSRAKGMRMRLLQQQLRRAVQCRRADPGGCGCRGGGVARTIRNFNQQFSLMNGREKLFPRFYYYYYFLFSFFSRAFRSPLDVIFLIPTRARFEFVPTYRYYTFYNDDGDDDW